MFNVCGAEARCYSRLTRRDGRRRDEIRRKGKYASETAFGNLLAIGSLHDPVYSGEASEHRGQDGTNCQPGTRLED